MVSHDAWLEAVAYLRQFDPGTARTSETELHASILAEETDMHQQPASIQLPMEILTMLCSTLLVPPEAIVRIQNEGEQHDLSATTIRGIVSGRDEAALAYHLLSQHLPRFFKAHPRLNARSGRAALRVPGGDKAVLDWFERDEGQLTWRTEPWFDGVVEWAINATPTNEIERSWPLLLPPLLAYLDDYDAQNKLCGVSLLVKLLEKVDGNLLKRTGVGALFEKSIQASITSLSSNCSPQLVLTSVAAAIHLIDLMHPTLSNASGAASLTQVRFDALCTLFDVSVLHIWSFKGGATTFELVAAQVLVKLIPQLDVMSARFLDVVIPKLAQTLVSTSEIVQLGQSDNSTRETNGDVDHSTRVVQLIEQLCLALATQIGVLHNDPDRLERFEARIVVSVAKAWANIVVEDRGSGTTTEIKRSLCGTYLARLEKVDARTFRPLTG
ncbi:hypothetical protein OIV83_005233 [Microbotryomycetes sp. JL201]|nr:hypothetical protein OIV83_005233 [Microbotryomycetes sp. JL201]